MKLEEAIKQLESYQNKLVYEITEKDREAVNVVLKELENSINKDKVKDKIEYIKKYNNGDDYSLINVVNILKDLLKADKRIESGKQLMTAEQERTIDKLKTVSVSGGQSYICNFEAGRILNLMQTYQKEIEKKDKIIDEMAEHIVSSAVADDTVCAVKFCEVEEECSHKKMLECTKQFFEGKALNE